MNPPARPERCHPAPASAVAHETKRVPFAGQRRSLAAPDRGRVQSRFLTTCPAGYGPGRALVWRVATVTVR